MPTRTTLDTQAVAALYDTDLYAWDATDAELLRQGNYQQVDVLHLIERGQRGQVSQSSICL